MSFWDNVKKFAQPYDDDDYDDYDEEFDDYEEPAEEPAPRARRTLLLQIPALLLPQQLLLNLPFPHPPLPLPASVVRF